MTSPKMPVSGPKKINPGSPEQISLYKEVLQMEGGVLTDLEKKAIRFGLANDLVPIGRALTPLPRIFLCIDEARRTQDEPWLKKELLVHGINYTDPTENFNNTGRFTRMAYILYKIAGCTEEEMKLDLSLNKFFIPTTIQDFERPYMDMINKKVQERGQFMLLHPELDFTQERIGTNKIPNLSELLKRINHASDLNSLEIFHPTHIPEYFPRTATTHYKSRKNRTLKVVLWDICLILENPNWKEIVRLSGRKKTDLLAGISYSHAVKMYSDALIKCVARKRLQFQQATNAKLYPIDNVEWERLL